MYKYIGKKMVGLRPGNIYKAKKVKDEFLGDCYSVLDGSGEWYLYGKKFFEENFRIVEE